MRVLSIFTVSFQLQQFTRIRLGFRTEISVHMPWGEHMKKIVAALAVTAALTGSATAADLAARPYTKAPAPMAPVHLRRRRRRRLVCERRRG
jgi:hypothetical protein